MNTKVIWHKAESLWRFLPLRRSAASVASVAQLRQKVNFACIAKCEMQLPVLCVSKTPFPSLTCSELLTFIF